MDYGRRACCFCSMEVDTKSNNSVMLMTAWVKSNGKTVFRLERHEYKFAHNYCLDTNSSDNQLNLF
jgi:hypothetical protein